MSSPVGRKPLSGRCWLWEWFRAEGGSELWWERMSIRSSLTSQGLKKKEKKKKVGSTCHVCNLFWLLNLKLRGLDTDCKHFPLIRPHFPLGRSLRRKLELDKDRWFNESAYWNTTHVGRRLHLGPWKHLPWQMLTVWPKWQASPVLVQLHKWISIWGV